MSVQIALLAPATRVASRKLGPDRGQALGTLPAEQPARLADEQVGEHVRQVRDARHQAIVRLGVDRGWTRAERPEQPVQALVQDPGGAVGGGQVPRGAVEQILARMLHARGLGARERVTADEALVGARVGERAASWSRRRSRRSPARRLRARAGRRRAGRPRAQRRTPPRRRPRPPRGPHRPRRPRRSRAPSRAPPRRGRTRARAHRLARALRGRSIRRSTRRRGRLGASGQGAAVRARAARRSRTDCASPSSSSTVVFQSMQPSVIDCP